MASKCSVTLAHPISHAPLVPLATKSQDTAVAPQAGMGLPFTSQSHSEVFLLFIDALPCAGVPGPKEQ